MDVEGLTAFRLVVAAIVGFLVFDDDGECGESCAFFYYWRQQRSRRKKQKSVVFFFFICSEADVAAIAAVVGGCNLTADWWPRAIFAHLQDTFIDYEIRFHSEVHRLFGF